VTLTSVVTTGQGTDVKKPTFSKAGPVVSTKTATTIAVKTTSHVAHPEDNAPVVGNKGAKPGK
jgi:hypothetical protein